MAEPLRILLVEDDEDDFVMTRDLLREIPGLKFVLEWVASYELAVGMLQSKDYDVFLFDYRLGAHTGLDLLAEVRQLKCVIPVIIMTGQGDSEVDRTAMEAGAADYLVKGKVDSLLLERSIRYAQQNARMLAELERERSSLADRVEERTRELSLANARLQHALKAKDEFLAGTSHELRTPLTGILAMSEVLMEGLYGPLSEKQLQFAHNIYDSGRHLLDLINDILDIAKVEAGKMELSLGSVAVPQFCEAVLRLVKSPAAKQGLSLGLELDPAVTTLNADERRLKQVLVNLLSNAVKFTPQGGRIGLRIQGDARAGVVRLIVWDTGIGIPAQQQALLFQPFVQLDSKLSRKYQGTGLGLFLVDSMTKLHGGKVEIESEEGKGSKFTVTLPWENSDEQMSDSTAGSLATEWQPAAAAILSSESGLKAKRILLADDDEKNRFIYSEYLRSKGYLVETATNGVEALEAAVTKNPNLILMDVQMPEMDGLEAIRKLRELPQFLHIPIIALTALAMEGDSEHCLEAGADLYLSKPVPLKVLLATVMEALDDNC